MVRGMLPSSVVGPQQNRHLGSGAAVVFLIGCRCQAPIGRGWNKVHSCGGRNARWMISASNDTAAVEQCWKEAEAQATSLPECESWLFDASCLKFAFDDFVCLFRALQPRLSGKAPRASGSRGAIHMPWADGSYYERWGWRRSQEFALYSYEICAQFVDKPILCWMTTGWHDESITPPPGNPGRTFRISALHTANCGYEMRDRVFSWGRSPLHVKSYMVHKVWKRSHQTSVGPP
jgi:hypothetical protein